VERSGRGLLQSKYTVLFQRLPVGGLRKPTTMSFLG
jgi:hypothetical protein